MHNEALSFVTRGLKVGDLAKPPALDDSQLAAWTAVANVLLNLNETISD